MVLLVIGHGYFFFYLSKYYEFVDTWLVIAKGRRPIFLQKFHHVGAVFSCWFGVVTRSNGYYLFVVLNSFIHTIMYFYYACSAIGIRFKYKIILTMMQMLQFVVGWTCLVTQLILFKPCLRNEDVVSYFFVLSYLTILFFLFKNFYDHTYKDVSNGKKKV